MSDDDRSCWIGSNVVGGKMSGVVAVFRLAVLLPESTVGTDDAAVVVAAEGV